MLFSPSQLGATDMFSFNTTSSFNVYVKATPSALRLCVNVPAGTLTHSRNAEGIAFTYTLKEDVVLKENMSVAPSWEGENSIYQIYPPTEVEKNPNLKR